MDNKVITKLKILEGYTIHKYENLKEAFTSIDGRINNYFLITALFWGVLIQTAKPTIDMYARCRKVLFWCEVDWWLFFAANVLLLTTILGFVMILWNIRFSLPGHINIEECRKIVKSKDMDEDRLRLELLENYVDAYEENIRSNKNRKLIFAVLKLVMTIGIISTVLHIGIFGILHMNAVEQELKIAGKVSISTKEVKEQ